MEVVERPHLWQHWDQLKELQKALAVTPLSQLFTREPDRFTRYSLELPGLLFDFSKQRLDKQSLMTLLSWVEAIDLQGLQERLVAGELLNVTEARPALHMALRDPSQHPLWIDGHNVREQITDTLTRMAYWSQQIRTGQLRNRDNEPFTDILSLGIGGSDLGPQLVLSALATDIDVDLQIHFVSNIDSTSLTRTLQRLRPQNTLVLINSKTFTTLETLHNARLVQAWLQQGGASFAQQVFAITAAPARALAFGVSEGHILRFWDWVGGRYSVWSAVGFPIALLLGMERFKAFLAGAHAIDRHAGTAEYAKNIPVMMALLGIWNTNFWGCNTHAVLPYTDSLHLLVPYLQQLEMESNGKGVDLAGEPVAYHTAPIVWGGVGCNGQHAYMQLLHQGTLSVPVDFIMPIQVPGDYASSQEAMLANCLAQSQALMVGRQQEASSVRACPGNRVSSTFLLERLSPYQLGSLLALYEHKVFIQAALWGINPFDQWGVELGKQLAQSILPAVQDAGVAVSDASTRGLLDWYHRYKR